MNDNDIKNYIKNNPDIYFKPARRTGYVCPVCGNGTGETGDGLAPYSDNRFKCFKCGTVGDVFDFIGKSENITDFSEQLARAKEIYNITEITPKKGQILAPRGNKEAKTINKIQEAKKEPKKQEDYTNFILEAHKRIGETDYPAKRGLTDLTINRFKLGFNGQNLIIPTSDFSYNERGTGTTKFYKKNGQIHIFNIETLENENLKYVFIAEGEFDAMAIIEAGHEAVGLGGTNNVDLLLKHIKSIKTDAKFIISLDNDQAGREATEKLKNELIKLNKQVINYNVSGNYKDPSEALTSDKEQFKENLNNAIKQYDKQAKEYKDKNNTYSYIIDFINKITNVDTPATPTGFNKLDKILDGGLYEGLYFIGAMSSLGKTTLVLQMADNIANQGQDVLIFSLEMARTELMAKSISRNTYKIGMDEGINPRYFKTTRGITTGKRYENYNQDEIDLIKKAMEEYEKAAKNLYIIEGIGNIGANEIKNKVEEHINITGKRPVVIIDYIQILAPFDQRATDKQNTDKTVLELKRLSRDQKIPIIGISSFNRDSYNKRVSMASFKESGAVEYTSDVLFGLQVKSMEDKNAEAVEQEKQKEIRNMELVILKNRNGATGKIIELEYNALFNHFQEV